MPSSHASTPSISNSSNSAAGSSASKADLDPIVRNALRYTLSAKEYKLLHEYLISRAPAVRRRTPPPPKYEASVKKSDDYNAAAVRASVRLALGTYGALKLWDTFLARIGRGRPRPKDARLWKSTNVRLSMSLSFILLFHRLLHRFFTRLRESLLTDQARPFRKRNPRVAQALTSRLAPAIGASLSGFFLGVYPSDQLRITITIYAFTRSLEFLYNYLEDQGWFTNRPWWFGSWLLMPAAYGQLFHAFVFDRDCFPTSYASFLLNKTPSYVHPRPAQYPKDKDWPTPEESVDALAEIARLRWPPFTSPILFPNKETLPKALAKIGPITSPAHPAIKSLSCALLHPHDPSCIRTYLSYWIETFPSVARLMTLVYGGISLFKYKSFADAPMTALNLLAKKILKMSVFITGLIGTSWASVCLMVNWLPRNLLPTQRFYLAGFISGLFAFLDRKAGRGHFLYTARMSLDSFWKVGVKHGWWRGIRNGDVLLFVASLAIINTVYEKDPKAISGGVVRKGLSMLRGDGWVDRAVLSTLSPADAQKVEERDVTKQGSDPLDTSEKK